VGALDAEALDLFTMSDDAIVNRMPTYTRVTS
jgi:hypothetical protein